MSERSISDSTWVRNYILHHVLGKRRYRPNESTFWLRDLQESAMRYKKERYSFVE
jgi:hypothetical protein